MSVDEGKFILKKKTTFREMAENPLIELPESDLCFQDGENVYQYKFEKPEDESTHEITPGSFVLSDGMAGLQLKKLEFKPRFLLETASSTARIIKEANIFFSRLHVYEKLQRPKKRGVLLYSDPGMGKCLDPNTEILMFDGAIKKAKDVILGDKLMGPDSLPRNVLGTTSGQDVMYRITPNKGDSYVVNSAHILSLKNTDTGDIVNINVKDYLALSKTKRSRLKGWRTGVSFEKSHLTIDPYFLGLWLGDGTSSKAEICSADEEIASYIRNIASSYNLKIDDSKLDGKATTYRLTSGTNCGPRDRNTFLNELRQLNLLKNKHIPYAYKVNSRDVRLNVLAGLIDTDGSLVEGTYDITTKYKSLADDICFIARSLGFAAYCSESYKAATNSKLKVKNLYHRIHISGDISEIPVLLKRKKANKRRQIKSVLRTGITVEEMTVGSYNGFELDGDHLFLLGDFTVTHNTSAVEKVCSDLITEDPGTIIIVWPTSEIEADKIVKLLSTNSRYAAECTRMVLIIEDIGGGERESHRSNAAVDSGLLNLLDGVGVIFRLPTFIIATTNHPENLLASLADRPGRFDLMMKLQPPSHDEKKALMKFICKRDLTVDEEECLGIRGTEGFSIAHLEEIAVRAELHDKGHAEVVDELVKHKELFKRDFEDKNRRMGINFDD